LFIFLAAGTANRTHASPVTGSSVASCYWHSRTEACCPVSTTSKALY